jgi:hypothetical protein
MGNQRRVIETAIVDDGSIMFYSLLGGVHRIPG